MNAYANPTENAAIGAVDRQFRAMERRAEQIAALKKLGLLSPAELRAARRHFPGIFAGVLRRALDAAENPEAGK